MKQDIGIFEIGGGGPQCREDEVTRWFQSGRFPKEKRLGGRPKEKNGRGRVLCQIGGQLFRSKTRKGAETDQIPVVCTVFE